MNSNRRILGISFLLLGFFSVLEFFGILLATDGQILGTALLLYSIPTVYFSLEKGERAILAFATAVFCAGVVMIVKSYFEILDARGIVFTSILFAGGAVFFLLFIENVREKILSAVSLTMILLSYLSATYFREWGLFTYANKIGDIFEIFWPVILIVFGMSVFINRKR
ncbi:MAG: hypothetical protein WC061_11280 [Melioribacteraceae bacterium]